MLVAEGIHKRYAGIVALDGAELDVARGEVVGLVGPNGSGKSTLLNVLSGFGRCDEGTVVFLGRRIERMGAARIARLGLQRTFQLAAQPERMTVLEVMLAGARLPLGSSPWASLLRPRRVGAEQRAAIGAARELLDELTLAHLEDHPAGMLSGGQQKLLSLGAVLMGDPQLLLLDEPTAGVHPTLRRTLVQRLRAVNARGTTLVIVEHDMGFVRDLCGRAYVLDKGRVVTCRPPHELAHDKRVVEAYLGSAGRPTAGGRAAVREREVRS